MAYTDKFNSTGNTYDLPSPYVTVPAPTDLLVNVPLTDMVSSTEDAVHIAQLPLRSLLDSERFIRSPRTSIALGMNTESDPLLFDIAQNRHLLITGNNPDEISAIFDSIVCSSLCKAYPYDIRMIMADPVRNSARHFNGIPHLLMPVISDPGQARSAIRWVASEINRRSEFLSKYSTRSIDSLRLTRNAMPHIVLFINNIDELTNSATVECLVHLDEILTNGPRFGIHLIAASKVNLRSALFRELNDKITHKIVFRLKNKEQSLKTICHNGAESLSEHGEMFFYDSTTNICVRSSCPTVTEDEITDLVSYFRNRGNLYTIAEEPIEAATLFEHATEIIFKAGKASIGLLQRSLGLDYSDAVVLIYQMEQEGIIEPVGEPDSGKVIISREEWEKMKR